MSTPAKIGMALFGTLIFLLVSLSLLVKVMVTPEKVRENLLPLAEESLNRKVDFGAIDIGIFSGVSLTDLRVQKKDSAGDFITIKSLDLHYKLLALLTGDLVIDQILLEEPRIEVTRNPDGQFNFSDLQSGHAAQGELAGTEKPAGKDTTSVFDLLIKKVSISGGELLFIDRSQNAKSPYRYQLDNLDFNASRITLENSFPVALAAELNGSKIKVSGLYDLDKQTGDLDLQLASLDLIQFAPYYRQFLPGKLGSALLALNLEVQLQPNLIESKGKLTLDTLDLLLNDMPEAAVQNAKLMVDYALNFDLEKQKLTLSTMFVNFNDSIVGVEGGVELAKTEPNLDLALLFNKLDLRKLLQGIPPGLTKSVRPYSLAGQIDGRVELAGTPSAGTKLLKSAALELIDVQATVDTLRAGVSGKIAYADQQAEATNLLLKVADQQVTLDFKAANLMGEIIQGQFQLSAEQLDLNHILPSQPPTTETGLSSSSQLPPVERQQTVAEEIGPFDIPVNMTGTLSVAKLIYKQLNLDKVRADLILKDNLLQVIKLRSGIAGGEFLANTDVDLGVKGLRYSGSMKLDQSQMLPLISGLIPEAEQNVSGLLQSQNNFAGRGTIPDNLLNALQVKGVMQLQKGKITGSPLLEKLATFLGIPDLKILSFETLEGHYDLRDGLANLSGQLYSSKARLKPEGTVGVDGTLNMKLDARIAPELMQNLGVKTGLQQAVSDQAGWGVLPLSIQGSLTRPKIAFDAKALQKQASQKMTEETTQKLADKIAPKGSTEQAPVKQLLEGTLNKLFGN